MKQTVARFCQWVLLGSLGAMAAFAAAPGYWMELESRLLLSLIQSGAALAAGLGLGGERGQKIRRTARLLLAVYLTHLISLLFFDGEFGRHNTFRLENWRLRTNLRPFATMAVYWKGMRRGWVSKSAAVINLLGNLLALAPLGFAAVRLEQDEKNRAQLGAGRFVYFLNRSYPAAHRLRQLRYRRFYLEFYRLRFDSIGCPAAAA